MKKENKKIYYNVKSTEYKGHWRSARFWTTGGTDCEESEITQLMRDDPRLVITLVEEVDADDG